MSLPGKTVERLSQYRRSLIQCMAAGKQHIFSHELASLHNNTAVQVRRDIMLLGYTGRLRKGYDVRELSSTIGSILDPPSGYKICIVGMGNLGRAITGYFNGKRSKLVITAAFDIEPSKIGRVISGVKCYHISQLNEIVKQEDISIGIIATTSESAADVAEKLTLAGIKGILNYTSASLNVSPQAYLEEYDMITSIEKVAFFVKKQSQSQK